MLVESETMRKRRGRAMREGFGGEVEEEKGAGEGSGDATGEKVTGSVKDLEVGEFGKEGGWEGRSGSVRELNWRKRERR